MEAAARLHRRADHDELGAALRGDLGDVLPEQPRARADDLPADCDAIRARDGGGGVEPVPYRPQLVVEVRVERQLALDDERGDEHDAGATVGGEPAREVERMLRLLPLEQRHDDAAVGDRARPAREAPRAAVQQPEIQAQPHRIT